MTYEKARELLKVYGELRLRDVQREIEEEAKQNREDD